MDGSIANALGGAPDHDALMRMSHTLALNNRTEASQTPDVDIHTQSVRRRPGRPKGSGKKRPEADSPFSSQIKRPVGRPRKDGFPAGSVGPRRSTRPRKTAPGKSGGDVSTDSGAARPSNVHQTPTGYHSFSLNHQTPYEHVPPMGSLAADRSNSPHLGYPPEPDSWSELARSRPTAFLHTLVEALDTPTPVSSAGPSVEEAFKSHLVSLSPNPAQAKGTEHIPSLYSILKTFWLPSSPSYFSLTASTSNTRTPSEHRFLYWDPLPLVFNGIPCPYCSVHLINQGRIRSGPVKIYDLERPFFIVGCEYVCKSSICIANTSIEGRKFASTDSSILRSLPVKLKDEFPALLKQGDTDAGSGVEIWNWHAMGVSRSLWNMIKGCLKVNLDSYSILQVLRSIQFGVTDEYEKREEEEEDEDDEEEIHQELAQRQEIEPARSTGDMQLTYTDALDQDQAADAYNNAWEANAAITDIGAHRHTSDVGPSSADASNPATSAIAGPSQHYEWSMSLPYPYPPYTPFQQTHPAGAQPMATVPPVSTSQHIMSSPVSLKRTFQVVESGPSDIHISEPSQKRTRHCCKCGSHDCKGKGGRSFCVNACQDCGKLDCKGRNSRRPDKSCANAWS